MVGSATLTMLKSNWSTNCAAQITPSALITGRRAIDWASAFIVSLLFLRNIPRSIERLCRLLKGECVARPLPPARDHVSRQPVYDLPGRSGCWPASAWRGRDRHDPILPASLPTQPLLTPTLPPPPP